MVLRRPSINICVLQRKVNRSPLRVNKSNTFIDVQCSPETKQQQTKF
jgi:hypothetical protein